MMAAMAIIVAISQRHRARGVATRRPPLVRKRQAAPPIMASVTCTTDCASQATTDQRAGDMVAAYTNGVISIRPQPKPFSAALRDLPCDAQRHANTAAMT